MNILRHKYPVIMTALAAALLFAELAAAFRCGNNIIKDGMHEAQVVAKCGQPTTMRDLGMALRGYDYQANFINRINSILRGHEVSPTSLELEITETTLMENPARTVTLLDQLYGLGLHLAIDDFGTGYSSLSALQQFPISTLKIDQSFVRDIANNPDDATLVGTIIQMGRNLNMDVVAEGVENEEQLSFLQRLECTFVQGLLFGDPMSSDNFLELLIAQADGTDTHRALFA